MTEQKDDKPCNWCFPALLLIIATASGIFYSAGYETGYLAGQLHELEHQIDTLERRVRG